MSKRWNLQWQRQRLCVHLCRRLCRCSLRKRCGRLWNRYVPGSIIAYCDSLQFKWVVSFRFFSPHPSGNGEQRCHNGGECIEGKGLNFTCSCAAGWHGRYCELETDECESSPCQNGAVCVDKLASYACACSMGYTGMNCEEEVQVCEDSPCRNSALCLMEEGLPVCYCVPDFHGEKCESKYDECQLMVPRWVPTVYYILWSCVVFEKKKKQIIGLTELKWRIKLSYSIILEL